MVQRAQMVQRDQGKQKNKTLPLPEGELEGGTPAEALAEVGVGDTDDKIV